MSLLLVTWVCDLCTAEQKRSRIHPGEPFNDPDYTRVAKADEETGDFEWANVQLQAGRTVEFLSCDHKTYTCVGWQYRYRKGNVETRNPKTGNWGVKERLNPGKHVEFNEPGHTFRVVKST
jgi:plastocyanin